MRVSQHVLLFRHKLQFYYFINILIFSFQLAWYPFDVQECNMTFTPEAVDAFSVELTSGQLDYTGPTKLDQYHILDTQLLEDTITQYKKIGGKTIKEKVVYVKITFGRGLLSIVLNVFFITFILNVVGHTSAIYKAQYFESQVALNVTIMLVQVTIFTAVSSSHYIHSCKFK